LSKVNDYSNPCSPQNRARLDFSGILLDVSMEMIFYQKIQMKFTTISFIFLKEIVFHFSSILFLPPSFLPSFLLSFSLPPSFPPFFPSFLLLSFFLSARRRL
jgi:hypothetical protein